jgi:hypothetical protein
MKPVLPKKDRAILASHEAGMHDKKPRPDTCRACAEVPEPTPAPAPEPILPVEPAAKPAVKPGVQGTRMLKVECPDCGYTLRTTRKWLDTGLPSCPAGNEMQEVHA